ncbi:2-oxoglutarate and iron-dependent oxygenase JMJD4-like [Clytia hemisphaerica]|uniref:2-oxoglutarate and iron-dependent oxygenase JMJD4-like n=1 Tax=Clytia hemisphaerica TaxID=252671 RepID=UPI0034D6D0B4
MVDRIEKNILYEDFVARYLKENKPCIFSSNLIADWKCANSWVKGDHLNTDFIEKHFVNLTAPVMDCNRQYFSSHEKEDMKVSEFIKYWNDRDDRLLYLKDWHLQKLADERFYDIPTFFTSDWLNEYFDRDGKDDYRFLYIGVKGSWTSFHADVFRSYSWSANVCGLKKWIFFPPGEEDKLRDNFGNLPFDVSSLSLDEMDITYFVTFQKSGEVIFVPSGWHHQVFNLEDTVSINHNWVNAFIVCTPPPRIVGGGFAVLGRKFLGGIWKFSGSRWEKQVKVGVNFFRWGSFGVLVNVKVNFFLSLLYFINNFLLWDLEPPCILWPFSIGYFWNHLTSTLRSVQKEISDCAEMDGFDDQCQLILLSCAGMPYKGFYEMLCYLAIKRLQILESEPDNKRMNAIFISSQPGVVYNDGKLSKGNKYNQLITDLRMIKEMLLFLTKDSYMQRTINKVEL